MLTCSNTCNYVYWLRYQVISLVSTQGVMPELFTEWLPLFLFQHDFFSKLLSVYSSRPRVINSLFTELLLLFYIPAWIYADELLPLFYFPAWSYADELLALFYFPARSYADVGVHEEMLGDIVRTNAYRYSCWLCVVKCSVECFLGQLDITQSNLRVLKYKHTRGIIITIKWNTHMANTHIVLICSHKHEYIKTYLWHGVTWP